MQSVRCEAIARCTFRVCVYVCVCVCSGVCVCVCVDSLMKLYKDALLGRWYAPVSTYA